MKPDLGATLLDERGEFWVVEMAAPGLIGERIEIGEMAAIQMAQDVLESKLRRKRIISNVDNTADVYILIKCQTSKLRYAKISAKINAKWRQLESTVFYRYVNTSLNTADFPTREH